MANTKKTLEEEFTKAPQAQTEDDVNNQDSRTRLWQSLNTTYNNQMEESDKAYDKSISQLANAMLAKGMGRSSYAVAEAARMYDDKNNARNKLGQALIADYQNRIGDIERQEKEDEWKQKEFDEGVRQFNEGQALTREQAELNRKYQTSEREAQQKYNTSERESTQAFQAAQTALQQAYNTSERIAQQAYNTGEREAEQAFQAGQTEKQQGWQSGENALNRAQDQAQFDIQQAFNEKQWQAQQGQWREEFDYNKMSNDQKIAFSVITAALESGNDADDATLKRAGISRAEFNTMKAQAQASGVVRSNPDKKETPPENMSTEDAFNAIMNAGGNNKTHAKLVTTSQNNHEKSHAKLVTTSKK